jgi:hypothetical protein
VKVVYKNRYRAVSYSILKHYNARNDITVDNQTFVNIAMFTLSDSKPPEILHTLCGTLCSLTLRSPEIFSTCTHS